MKFQGIRKVCEGKFITRYDVDYVTAQGNPKTYEIISRNRDIRRPMKSSAGTRSWRRWRRCRTGRRIRW